VEVVEDPIAADLLVSKGAWGWAGAYGTNVHIEPQEHMVQIIVMQTSTPALQRDYCAISSGFDVRCSKFGVCSSQKRTSNLEHRTSNGFPFHCWDDRFANVERSSATQEIIPIDTNRFTVRTVKSTKLAW